MLCLGAMVGASSDDSGRGDSRVGGTLTISAAKVGVLQVGSAAVGALQFVTVVVMVAVTMLTEIAVVVDTTEVAVTVARPVSCVEIPFTDV